MAGRGPYGDGGFLQSREGTARWPFDLGYATGALLGAPRTIEAPYTPPEVALG